MKQGFLNVLKVVLMFFGALFLIQWLIVSGILIGINNFIHTDFLNFISPNNAKIKPIQPIINYVENYKNENGIFPTTVSKNDVKIKSHLSFEYEPNKELNCYTIIMKSNKSNVVKKYQRCSVNVENSISDSQSFVEYNE